MSTTVGISVPLSFLVGMRISTTAEYLNAYVSHIYVAGTYVTVAVSSVNNNGSISTLGTFSADITSSYQSIPMYPANNRTHGNLVIGDIQSLSVLQGTHQLDFNNGRIEDSCLVCIPVPGVTGILNAGKKAIYKVTLRLDNISEQIENLNIKLDVINKQMVETRNDVSSTLSNCRTNIIQAINSVKPDLNGNIDIYGIAPITIAVSAGGEVSISSTISTREVCPEANQVIPPILFSNLDSYPDIMTVTTPEWKTWPNFN